MADDDATIIPSYWNNSDSITFLFPKLASHHSSLPSPQRIEQCQGSRQRPYPKPVINTTSTRIGPK